MIAGLIGTVQAVRDSGVVQLRCGPVVLEVQMPLVQARGLERGAEAELYTHLYLSTSADQLKLFGFVSPEARDIFAVLITASGVGPKVALALLELGTAGLVAAVRDADERTLTSVPGIGPKLAKKVILELSEKVAREFAGLALIDAAAPAGASRPSSVNDALDAAVTLGYPRLRAEQALASVRRDYNGDDTATLIRRMLAVLSGQG